MNHYVVCCGDLHEFKRYCAVIRDLLGGTWMMRQMEMTNGLKDNEIRITYVSSPLTLRGLRNYEFVRYGTYYKRKDFSEINALWQVEKAFRKSKE